MRNARRAQRLYVLWLIIFVTLCGVPSLTPGQTPSTTTPQSRSISPQTAPPSESTISTIHPEPEPSKPILETPRFFTRAADKGVFFRLSFNEELAGNPSGGIRQGFSASQYMIFGSDLDLRKL